MTTYNFQIAKDVLTEAEKDRIVACYLNLPDVANNKEVSLRLFAISACNLAKTVIQVDFKKAAADFGAASVDSFKKMLQGGFKKIVAAQEKAANGGTVDASPASAKAKGGKKRKAATEEDEDDVQESKPKPKRGRKAKKPTPEANGTSCSSMFECYVD